MTFLIATEEEKREMSTVYTEGIESRIHPVLTDEDMERFRPKGSVTLIEQRALEVADKAERLEEVLKGGSKWDLVRVGIVASAWLARKLR